MSDEQFTKLFRHMQEEFGLIRDKLDSIASQKDMNRVLSMLDELARKQDISDKQRQALR